MKILKAYDKLSAQYKKEFAPWKKKLDIMESKYKIPLDYEYEDSDYSKKEIREFDKLKEEYYEKKDAVYTEARKVPKIRKLEDQLSVFEPLQSGDLITMIIYYKKNIMRWIQEEVSENEEIYEIGCPYPVKLICRWYATNNRGERKFLEEKIFDLGKGRSVRFDDIDEDEHSDGTINLKD